MFVAENHAYKQRSNVMTPAWNDVFSMQAIAKMKKQKLFS